MKLKLSEHFAFKKDWKKEEIKEKTDKMLLQIGELQYKMYAQNKYSLLIIFQGMDASGKDGVTKGLLKYCNPIGINIESFKKPTEEEYAHDFLWRIHKVCPRKGEMGIFIRSHYEDILVPTVEKFIEPEVIEQRYHLINEFERILEHNNTKVLKFFLNISEDEQKERLMERVLLKEKNWKHKDGDWDTREKFSEYLKVYERIINSCNMIPWHIVPADRNWQKLYAVSEVVLKTLEDLDIKWPALITEKFRNHVK